MFEPKNVILAVVLTAPFGLAIHDDVTRDKPDADDLQQLGASLLGTHDSVLTINPEEPGPEEAGPDEAGPDEADAYMQAKLDREVAAWRKPAPPRAPSKQALNQLFGAERATPGAELADLRFGLTRSQLERQMPALRAWEERSDELGRVAVYPEFMANNNAEFSDLVLEIPDPDLQVETYVRERWGAPQIEAETTTLPAIWISPDGHTRAAISAPGEDMSVVFSPVQSVEELLTAPAGSRGLFSFETGPALIGSKVETLTESYPSMTLDRYYQDYATLDVPGISSDPGASPFTRVTMAVKSGVVESLSLKIGCGERCTDVITAFEARFGKSRHKPSAKHSDQIYRFETTPEVTLTIYGHEDRMVAVEVAR